MRRADFLRTDPEFFALVAERCSVGILGLVTEEGYPRSVAMDFVASGETIYFHGARAGEKHALISAGGKVGFTMVRELSYIPSTWSGPRYACPATHLYQSVEIKGHCREVKASDEKARALQALMLKYQPEGGFDAIRHGEKIYRKALEETGVFRVDADSWTGKWRLFQEKNAEFRARIVAKLKERDEPLDRLTVAEMEKLEG